MIPAAAPPSSGPRPWWETRPFIAAMILLSMVPLLYPPIPPIVDLLGHMGRFRVELDLNSSPWLHQYYDFRWRAIGNLGVDLLVLPLAPLFGLETAVKLIMIATAAMTATGFLWVAREVHNRIPPTALFALPLVYNHPFFFGFVNFALSMALAFLAFGLWLRLGRLEKFRLRLILFVPISIIIFFTHTFGWGVLGLMAFSAEAVRLHDRGTRWMRAAIGAGLQAACMAIPLFIMLLWRTESSGGITTDWFNMEAKVVWLASIFRDRWKVFDIGSMMVLLAVILEALRNKRLGFSRNLGFTVFVLLAMFILLPRIIFNSAYADMRLAPYVFAIALLAIRFRSQTHYRTAQVLAVLGLAFFLVRIGSSTISLAMASQELQGKLKALDHVPNGARVASFVGQKCTDDWEMPRSSHIGAMTIVRRQGFSNEQWDIAGSNLLTVRYRVPGIYSHDPSEIVRPNYCRQPRIWKIDIALRHLPREAFDYVWLVDPPAFNHDLLSGTQLVWSSPNSALYKITPGGEAPPPAKPRTASAPAR